MHFRNFQALRIWDHFRFTGIIFIGITLKVSLKSLCLLQAKQHVILVAQVPRVRKAVDYVRRRRVRRAVERIVEPLPAGVGKVPEQPHGIFLARDAETCGTLHEAVANEARPQQAELLRIGVVLVVDEAQQARSSRHPQSSGEGLAASPAPQPVVQVHLHEVAAPFIGDGMLLTKRRSKKRSVAFWCGTKCVRLMVNYYFYAS